MMGDDVVLPDIPLPKTVNEFEIILRRIDGRKGGGGGLHSGYKRKVEDGRRLGLSRVEARDRAMADYWKRAVARYRKAHPGAVSLGKDDLPQCLWDEKERERQVSRANDSAWQVLNRRVRSLNPAGAEWSEVVSWVGEHMMSHPHTIGGEDVPDIQCVSLLQQAQADPPWFWKLKDRLETKAKSDAGVEEPEKEERKLDEIATADLIDEFKRSMSEM